MKEFRVYVIEADETDATSYDIENWSLYAEYHNKLTADAEDFISECENKGQVYSLQGFQNACNLEYVNVSNRYIFITNCY